MLCGLLMSRRSSREDRACPSMRNSRNLRCLSFTHSPNRTQKIPGLRSLIGTCKASVCRGRAQQREGKVVGRHLETRSNSKGGEGQISAGRRCLRPGGGREGRKIWENRDLGRERPGYLFFPYMGTHTQ